MPTRLELRANTRSAARLVLALMAEINDVTSLDNVHIEQDLVSQALTVLLKAVKEDTGPLSMYPYLLAIKRSQYRPTGIINLVHEVSFIFSFVIYLNLLTRASEISRRQRRSQFWC